MNLTLLDDGWMGLALGYTDLRDGSAWQVDLIVRGPRALVRGVKRIKHPVAPVPRRCGGCGQVAVHRWLGLRWIGLPAPIRWWRRLGRSRTWLAKADSLAGCGCLLRLKAAWTAWKTA